MHFPNKEAGQGLIEYVLILVLIVIVVIAVLTLLEGSIESLISNILPTP